MKCCFYCFIQSLRMCDPQVAAMRARSALADVYDVLSSLHELPLSPVEIVLLNRATQLLRGLESCAFTDNVTICFDWFHKRLTKFFSYSWSVNGFDTLVSQLYVLSHDLLIKAYLAFHDLSYKACVVRFSDYVKLAGPTAVPSLPLPRRTVTSRVCVRTDSEVTVRSLI